jgi:GTP-binding protein
MQLGATTHYSPSSSLTHPIPPPTTPSPQVRTALERTAVLLGELTEDGQTLLVATGGRGGRGNSSMPSKPYGPASKARQDGGPGQRRVLLLETRLLADVVMVGLPNVGKSSLVAALTGARAQVGAYAFTTLRPQLGVLRFPDGAALTMADVPGERLAGAAVAFCLGPRDSGIASV